MTLNSENDNFNDLWNKIFFFYFREKLSTQNIWFEISPVFTIGHMNPQNITDNKIAKSDSTPLSNDEIPYTECPYIANRI